MAMADQPRDARDLSEFATSGSAEAFARLSTRYAGLVYRVCLRRLGSGADAEDASQAVFLALARKAGSVKPARLASWLHGASIRAAKFIARSRANRARYEREAARMKSLEQEACTDEARGALVHLDGEIGKLPSKLREAVTRHYLAGLSRAELARELGVPEGTVQSRLNAGLEKLRARLGKCGVQLGTAALSGLLASEATAGAPAALIESLPTLASGAATASGANTTADLIAKGVLRMMFWTKVKMCAAAVAAVAVVGIGTGVALSAAHGGEPTGTRKEKDSSGKEWTLTEWKEGSRPYKKNLIEREKAYKEKWGEHWAGKAYDGYRTKGPYTCSPGTWTWEEFAVIPDGKKASPGLKGGVWRWQKSQALVFAPGGGEEVTAVYAVTDFGMYHVDPKTKAITYAGVIPKYTLKPTDRKNSNGKTWHNLVFDPVPGIIKDGLDEKARLRPARSQFGEYLSVDSVTGRVYFHQATGSDKRPGRKPEALVGPYVLRYVEKLLPYTENGREVLLPALLDHKEMYKQVKGPNGGALKPVMKNGARAKARLAVRTTTVKFATSFLPGIRQWGKKMLLSPDGKAVYVETKPTWRPTFNKLHAIEIGTGRDLGELKKPTGVPTGPLGHGGTCSRLDGRIYQLIHPGCGGGPGSLFSFDMKTGQLAVLYDSHAAWPALRDGKPRDEVKKQAAAFKAAHVAAGTVDGPADAVSLRFVTTCYQSQCPRTGAIMNGGWDQSGIRRYHDGFVTSLANGRRPNSALRTGGRPEWDGQTTASWGNLQSPPDAAPNGDLYLTDCSQPGDFPGRDEMKDGLRIVKLSRTDWPEKQPVNGYANKFLPQTKRHALMLEYARKYIANYAELSKIY